MTVIFDPNGIDDFAKAILATAPEGTKTLPVTPYRLGKLLQQYREGERGLPTYNELAEMAQGVTLAGSAAFMAPLPEGFDGKLLRMAATPNGSIVIIQPGLPAHVLEYGAKEFVPLWPTAAPSAPTDK